MQDRSYLADLTEAQLKGVAGALEARIRDSKKKATQALSKDPELMKSWIATMSAVPATTSEEEDAKELVRKAREDRRLAFEKALVEHPEAYVLYHMANYLVGLSEAVRKERSERARK
jgi:hypothetical protein